jgi:GNAT superfamily N-acetyltransferase
MITAAVSVRLVPAGPEDAPALADLRNAVAENLTVRFGQGHWSARSTERGVLYDLRTSRIFVAWDGQRLLATLRLATKKPWAIDVSYFTLSKRALYLTSMAVAPELQRRGIGRLCLEDAERIVQDWPADAIRLDAYDAAAGAGPFYAKCGYREVGRVVYRTVPLIYFEKLL